MLRWAFYLQMEPKNILESCFSQAPWVSLLKYSSCLQKTLYPIQAYFPQACLPFFSTGQL